MTVTFDNGVVRLYQGDARQVLRELPAESVLDEDRCLRASVVQFSDRSEKVFAFRDHISRLTPLGGRPSAPCFGRFFGGSELSYKARLLSLDAEIGEQGCGHRRGDSIRRLPNMKRFAVAGRRLLDAAIAAEGFFQQIRDSRTRLFQANDFLVLRMPVLAVPAAGVCRPLDAEIPIRVYTAREVR